MIGEIILTVIISCIIWFIAFKVKLMYERKKINEDLVNKIEKQKNKKFIIDGKNIKIPKEIKKEDE